MGQRINDALIALRQILRATETNARALAKASSLSPSQLITLQVILSSGEATPSDLSREVSLSRGTITTLMRKLEGRGLVVRRGDEHDKRKQYFCLTEDGKEAIADAPLILQQRFTRKFETLDAWEQASLVAALERVAAMLGADELDAAPILDVGDISKVTL